MNAPDRCDSFLLPEGERKVKYQQNPKMPNAADFVILREDHTMGNLLRMQLLLDENVLFSGYQVPHPLVHDINLKVQTKAKSTPLEAMSNAIEDLSTEFEELDQRFRQAISTFKKNQEEMDYR